MYEALGGIGGLRGTDDHETAYNQVLCLFRFQHVRRVAQGQEKLDLNAGMDVDRLSIQRD